MNDAGHLPEDKKLYLEVNGEVLVRYDYNVLIRALPDLNNSAACFNIGHGDDL